jgi:transposase InsO family protein
MAASLPPVDLSKTKSLVPDYYYVIVVAGQSNTCYGEGQAFPDTYDSVHPRIKQLARRTNTKTSSTTGNVACSYNDIIPLDWCPHGVEDMAARGHAAAIAADARQYGCVSFAQSLAKRLLPSLPDNAGILIVSTTRGGSAFTQGTDQAYSATTGAPASSTRWGITGGLASNGGKTALYLDMRDRTKAALNKNPQNILLAVVWMQGEFDQTGTPGNHKSMFEAQVNDFRTELNNTNRAQCLGLDAAKVPWICGDTTIYFQSSVANFTQVYEGTYLNTTLSNVYYTRVGKDELGNWTATNAVADDPDVVVGVPATLANITSSLVGATLGGANLASGGATVSSWTVGATETTAWLLLVDAGFTKGVKVAFSTDNSGQLLVRATDAAYATGSVIATWDAATKTTGTVVTTDAGAGYGVKTLTINGTVVNPAGYVTATATTAVANVSTSKAYYGSASRTSSDWISSTRNSHFSSWAHRTIIAERFSAAITQTAGRLLPGITSPKAGGAPSSYVQGVSLSGSNIVVSTRNDITGGTATANIPIPATSVVNYAPSILTVGYNSRRGDGTMKAQGFTGSLEFAANTAAIAGATVIDGAAANNLYTLTNAITHPDGQGGYTYRHMVTTVGNGEWYKTNAGVNIADLAKLITFGGSAQVRAKITDAYVAQFMAALIAIVHDGNTLLPVGSLTGVQGTGNNKLAFLGHFIQAKQNGAVNSIYLSAWQNGGNVDLVNIPFDNNYHDYKLAFAGGGTPSITPSIDSVVGTARALHYTGAANAAYATVAAADTTTKLAITDITGSSLSLGFNLDTLQFVIYQDNGNIALSGIDANHSVTLQKYARSHTITIPDFAISPGKSIEITAENTGNVVVQGANSNVLIQPLGGSIPLPSAVTIVRASADARATYKFTQISADGKTWVRTA